MEESGLYLEELKQHVIEMRRHIFHVDRLVLLIT